MEKYIAKRELFDQDWKTQIARKYGNIPKGAIVDFRGYITNFYGRYAVVLYNGIHYYVKSDGIEKITVEDKKEELKELHLLGCSSCIHFLISNGQFFCKLHELTLRSRYERPCVDFERK